MLELVYCYDAVIAVLKVIEVEVDLGLIEDEDVTAVTLLLLVEDEMFFGIEVNRPVDTLNASSEDESDSESSIEAVVVVPKRQKKANTMIGDISKGKYSRS